MANRYRVGTNANWDDGVSGWSTTSGGTAGSADPTAADDVLFDGNSGTGTVTIAAIALCRSFNSTGYTGTIAGTSVLRVGDATVGNITIGSGMTWSHTSSIELRSTTGTNTITSNGVSLSSSIVPFGVGGVWQLAGALTLTHADGLLGGAATTFDTNGQTFTTPQMSSGDAGGTLTLGASTVNITGASGWYSSVMTLNANTSTINLTYTGVATSNITLGAKTFNNMTISAGGAGVINFTGATNNTFNVFTINAPKSVRFASTRTQTFTSFVADGSLGNVITIDASVAASAATLSDAAGTNAVTYVSLQDSTATGGASWTVANGTNVSGNTGWTFLVAGGGSTTTSTAMLVGVG